MTKLTILRGVSGSGKSTYAEAQAGHPAIVSRDRIRMSLFGTENFIDEDLVTAVEDSAIAAALKAGRNVIVDDTNTRVKYVKRLANIGYKAGAVVDVKTFDVPLETAIRRNYVRGANGGRFVPEDVIKRQHNALSSSKTFKLDQPVLPAPYFGTPGKPKAFMFDLDGTIAHMGDKRGPFEWHNVVLDDVDFVIAEIVGILVHGSAVLSANDPFDPPLETYTAIAMSGRDEVCRDDTELWLSDKAVPYEALFMRPKGDMRPDNIVKAELFDTHIRDRFDVKFVLEDRNQVVDMWRGMGLKTLQVAEGDF
jgi:predicted kinase